MRRGGECLAILFRHPKFDSTLWPAPRTALTSPSALSLQLKSEILPPRTPQPGLILPKQRSFHPHAPRSCSFNTVRRIARGGSLSTGGTDFESVADFDIVRRSWRF